MLKNYRSPSRILHGKVEKKVDTHWLSEVMREEE
jgi:hypothetical protein